MDIVSQVMIAITGVIAIWLSQDTDYNKRKYACLFGIIGQPFWMYVVFTTGQWGIFVLTFFYSYSWIKGINNYWIIPNKQTQRIKKVHKTYHQRNENET